MPHTEPIPSDTIPLSGLTVPFESHEQSPIRAREFHMIDASGSVAFAPVLLGEGVSDDYDIGAPVAEINAGTSRFAVFPDDTGGFFLASAQKGVPGESGRDRYTVDATVTWPLGEAPLTIGRADKPGERDGTISAQHFRVSVDTYGRVTVADAGSLNGTSLRRAQNAPATAMAEVSTPEDVTTEFQTALARGATARTEGLLRDYPELMPTRSVRVGDRTFYLTDIMDAETRYPKAVMYTSAEIGGASQMVSRLLYKSNSDGGWRVAYGLEGTRFVKESRRGIEDPESSHYTQETKPVRHLLDALAEQGEVTNLSGNLGDRVESEFSLDRQDVRAELTGRNEIRYYHSTRVDAALSEAQTLTAGSFSNTSRDKLTGMGYDTVTEYFQALDQVFVDLPGFLPDFRYPPRATYAMTHTLLGEVTVEEFDVQLEGRPVTWSMARDAEGRAWVENVYFADSDVSSYGTRTEVLDMGCITSKPLEYPQQASLLQPGEYDTDMRQNHGSYLDITPALGELVPVAFYRETRDLSRR